MNLKTWSLGVLVLALVLPFSGAAQTLSPTPLTINEATAPIRVDGHLNDWPSARMLVLDQAPQVVSGKAFWKGQDDFNGRVFITYDSLYLYAAAIVEKKGPPVNSNEKLSLWNGDCLELFLSTQPSAKPLKKLSSGDYHLGFSPGPDCKNPQMFCFNKNKEIVGGRVIARTTKTGYLLEACVPLTFFAGLDLGPGKMAGLNVALDEGGQVSGNRLLQMDYSRDPLGREHPGSWQTIQWSGTDLVSVPENHSEDLNAGAVKDGTKSATYAGLRTIGGKVLGPDGKPLAGAKITTWPKTTAAWTNEAGEFELTKIKVYDKTLLYARSEGFAAALAALPPKGKPVSLFPRPLSGPLASVSDTISSMVLGLNLRLPLSGNLDEVTTGTKDKAIPLHLKYLRLSGTELAAKTSGSERSIIDKFVSYARELGAEPIIEVPIDPESLAKAGEWVRYCNLEKKYNVLYWSVGDEPDFYETENTFGGNRPYSVYDYVNDFRTAYNAMKLTDSSIFILGPELAWKYTDGENDWLTPFVRYNGDIVDGVSVHRYACLKSTEGTVRSLWADLRSEGVILRNLRDKISSNTDITIPLMVTGGNAGRQPIPKSNEVDGDLVGFWPALWLAEKVEIAIKEKLGLSFFSYLKGGAGLDFLTENSTATYWVGTMLAEIPSGKLISAQIKNEDVSIVAIQEGTGDLNLLLVNKGDRYLRPKIRLDGNEADLTVDAGLKQGLDFEMPSYSVCSLKIKADNSPGQAKIYTKKMYLVGKGPETTVLKPW